MMNANLLPELDSIATACSNARQPVAVFRALDLALQRIASHKLMTILTYDEALTRSTRLYSSDPDAYPAGTSTKIASKSWAQSVIRDGIPYVGHRVQDLESVFNHHRKMAALGLGSVINMPIRWCGRTAGTLNMLHEEGRYIGVDLRIVKVFAQYALPPLLASIACAPVAT
ncbi:hypothetical protein B0G75_1305 [Paraburkholderia sp. BL18I3N2]|uniref:GAF domain-containing protein n=1 Tax=Paraburkholderia sp. BL18I3N2 TaxID=1938799 RepID=UPI000D049AE6|nr:GAF domain-containing protein [Paraburkholderia sp. BL18I3N2]PRX21617.1 hypothetical protein B0G75_1305 [Paraburkholderia sp. BL18I3N2]